MSASANSAARSRRQSRPSPPRRGARRPAAPRATGGRARATQATRRRKARRPRRRAPPRGHRRASRLHLWRSGKHPQGVGSVVGGPRAHDDSQARRRLATERAPATYHAGFTGDDLREAPEQTPIAVVHASPGECCPLLLFTTTLLPMARFIAEWGRVLDGAIKEGATALHSKIEEMAKRCETESRLYLRFVGD